MKKQQLVFVIVGLVVVGLLYFAGNTNTPKSADGPSKATQPAAEQSVTTETILAKAKLKIKPEQAQRIALLENAVVRGDVKSQQIHVFHQLARFWADSAHIFEPYAFYTAESAKLENSEKSLTFAAQLFLDNLLTEGEPAMQNWLGKNAKVLLDKALEINPTNDSTKIGLGICYMFGNISENPMEGILEVRKVVQAHPENLYGQMVLGMGGKKSGQYDKAIERFNLVLQKQPENLEAIFNLAECYELKGDKTNAIKWYQIAKQLVKVPEAKLALDKRIIELGK